MTFLEKNLEEIIYESSSYDLASRGLVMNDKKSRQVNIGNYGIADIITYFRESFTDTLVINIYELKRDFINIDSILQVYRYKKGILDYLDERKFNHNIEINCFLVGQKIETNHDYVYLLDSLNDLHIYTYQYRLDGLYFEYQSKSYRLKNNGFTI